MLGNFLADVNFGGIDYPTEIVHALLHFALNLVLVFFGDIFMNPLSDFLKELVYRNLVRWNDFNSLVCCHLVIKPGQKLGAGHGIKFYSIFL